MGVVSKVFVCSGLEGRWHQRAQPPAWSCILLGMILIGSRLDIFILRHFRILCVPCLSLCSLMNISLPYIVTKEVKRDLLRRQSSWGCGLCLFDLCMFLSFGCTLGCHAREGCMALLQFLGERRSAYTCVRSRLCS